MAAVGVALIPLVYLAVRVGDAGWARISEELFTARTGELAARSVALAGVVTTACTALGVASAFLVTRTDLPARRLFGVLAALPLAVPSYVAAFAWASTVEGFEGFWAAALVLTLVSYPYVFLPVAAALASADPAQEEVARSLGSGPWRTFITVTLRQVQPAVGAGALLVALYVLSDFGAVSVLRTDVLTRAIFTSISLGFDRTGALVLATVLVALTVLIVSGEQLTRRRAARYARLGGAGRPPVLLRLGSLRWPAAFGLVGTVALTLGIPAASLARWFGEGVSRPGTLTGLATAAGNSLTVSAAGAGLTLLLALPLGLLGARAPGPAAVVLDRLAYLSHALPGLVIGLSLVFFGINVAYPLYQSVWLLALAYAALFLPLAVAAVGTAAQQAPPALEEVARSLGRRRSHVLCTVTLPLAVPGIGAGAVLVFLTCMKELPATLLLRPTGMDTLATELWTQTSVSAYAAAAPYAALLVLLAAVPTWWLSARTGVLAPGGGS
ncbi:iron ABC transporter permease [Streptomyces ipomoeae]|uniref:ABC transporter permease n=1 Tax=Streptomyces ipomoeae TaxID=103232 RepID=UPI00215D317B|nr:iron ABC transporter permease [Streptomyces ipomoeae]MDX2820422.1 iron ABC transporter permease [Streptomyces ipomoeae]MDX2874028.1 iron ABC transporter permease [Streptomyces ipomoeae]